jgi:hypothetical protein
MIMSRRQCNGSLGMPCAHKARRILAASRTRMRHWIAATYGWTDVCKSGNGRHAAALRSPIVQPLRLYSIPTGCTQSRTVIRRLKLIEYAFSRGRLSPVSLTRHVHTGAFSRWELPIGTKYRALASQIQGAAATGDAYHDIVKKKRSKWGPTQKQDARFAYT